MLDDDYARLRLQALEQAVGSTLSPLTDSAGLLGAWDMRFGGPVGSDEIAWRYTFHADGAVRVDDDTWRWALQPDGTLSLIVPVAAMPEIEGLEDGGFSEERRLAFRAADGRVVLSNDDTSVIEVLCRCGGADAA